jgi:hypothetical protein
MRLSNLLKVELELKEVQRHHLQKQVLKMLRIRVKVKLSRLINKKKMRRIREYYLNHKIM